MLVHHSVAILVDKRVGWTAIQMAANSVLKLAMSMAQKKVYSMVEKLGNEEVVGWVEMLVLK